MCSALSTMPGRWLRWTKCRARHAIQLKLELRGARAHKLCWVRSSTHVTVSVLHLQTIHQARAEVAHGAGRAVRLASSDECVLPGVKARLRPQQREDRDSASSSPMLRNDRVSWPPVLFPAWCAALWTPGCMLRVRTACGGTSTVK